MADAALVPLREELVKTVIGPIAQLPTYFDALSTMQDLVVAESNLDQLYNFSSITMDMNGLLVSPVHNLHYTKHALYQAVHKIKPDDVVGMGGYLVACPPELRCVNYNYWHSEFFADATEKTRGNRIMLRTKAGEFNTTVLRAIVGSGYTILDDVPILKYMGEIIPDGAKLRTARGDLRSRFDILWPNQEKDIFPGDPILVALRVSNSETGSGSVRLQPMVYHVKSHGCVIIPTRTEDVAIRHVGEARKKLADRYGKVMGDIEPFIRQMQYASSDDIIKEFETLDQMWEALSKCYKFTELQIEIIKDAYNLKPTATRAGVVSAMIVAAQDFVISTGEEIQQAAGCLVKYGWQQVKRFVDKE